MVVVYSKPLCVQCDMSKRLLDRLGVDYSVVDVSVDVAGLERVKELGYLSVPVVVAGDTHWSGFQPERLEALV